ncbi:MAG: YdiY family protein [Phycisphaeraceae bacterium]
MKRVWGNNNKTTAALLAAGLSWCLVGEAIADRVELTNGDTLTGEVVEHSDKGVVLKHPALGTIAIGADRVKSVLTDPDEPDLVPQAQPQPEPIGPASQTSPAARPKPGKADRVKDDAEQAAADQPDERTALRRFLADWKSKLTLGLNGAGGQTDRQNYYVKFVTKYEQGRDRYTANAQWFYGTANGQRNQNQFHADFTRDWLQEDSPWFFFIKGQYRFDANRSWENRTSAFGGGGYTLAKTEDLELNTRVGFGGTYEYGEVNDFTPEALFGGSVVQWNLTERAAIAGSTTYYPSLEDAANFRIDSALEWTYKLDLAKGLSLKLGVENEYDSQTPNDAGHNDLRYYGAVVVSF